MWLIPCHDGDAEAVWIGERLRALGLRPLELITASELVHGARWEHRVDSRRVSTTLRLADGRRIDCAGVGGVLNRLDWLSADGYLGASEVDREYATAELQALVLSWLGGLGPRVLNPPVPPSLGPAWGSSCEWRARALAAGARVSPYASEAGPEPSGAGKLLVIDGTAVGAEGSAAGGTDPAIWARATGLDIFEASFAAAPDGGWELLDVNPMVAFSGAPDDAPGALARALLARTEMSSR